jgi:glycosyltransferase involved in cell wall biosynthesis
LTVQNKPQLPPEEHTPYKHGVSICIPAYNEQETIENSIVTASETLRGSGLPGEILVIDDCSTDKTWEILERLKTSVSNLQIRRHAVNRGIAETFRELYHWAGMDLVFLNSADGQWKMQVLIDMLPLMDKCDLVVARRKEKHYRLSRHVVSWVFNAVPILLFGTKTYDAGSVKLVRREIYNIPIISSGVFAEAERIIRGKRRGYLIASVDVEHFPRVAGKAMGAKPSLVIEAAADLIRCWVQIVILRRY